MKQKFIMPHLLVLAMLLFSFNSCKKNENEPEEMKKNEIKIDSDVYAISGGNITSGITNYKREGWESKSISFSQANFENNESVRFMLDIAYNIEKGISGTYNYMDIIVHPNINELETKGIYYFVSAATSINRSKMTSSDGGTSYAIKSGNATITQNEDNYIISAKFISTNDNVIECYYSGKLYAW